LPGSLTDAVNLHQSKDPGDDGPALVARILNSSDRIAKLLCEMPSQEDISAICLKATAFVGMDIGTLAAMLPTIENDIEELAEALRIDVIPSKVYALIAKTVEEQLGVST